MAKDTIIIKGAREHNLKNVDVLIPRDHLVVLTGVSGSGKSSLAFEDALRRRPTTVCGEPFLLRTPIFGADGKATG